MPACPHEVTARVMVETVLNDLEVPARISTTIVDSDEQARDLKFVGSPTFLINGHDPFADREAAVGLACRMYRTPDGIDGVPPLSSCAGRSAARLPAERGLSVSSSRRLRDVAPPTARTDDRCRRLHRAHEAHGAACCDRNTSNAHCWVP